MTSSFEMIPDAFVEITGTEISPKIGYLPLDWNLSLVSGVERPKSNKTGFKEIKYLPKIFKDGPI